MAGRRTAARRRTRPAREDARLRVAIVGGGMAGLTAAYELSRTAELRRRYRVTVYQMGFRLGGKLASGRNWEAGARNEEHGLHVWFGFYENTFRLAAEVLERWRAPEGSPFRSVWDIVRPLERGLLGVRRGDRVRTIPAFHPRNSDAPGSERLELSWRALLVQALDALDTVISTLRGRTAARHQRGWRARWGRRLWTAPRERSATRRRTARSRPLPGPPGWLGGPAASGVHRLLCLLHPWLRLPFDRPTRRHPAARTLFYWVDCALAVLRGLLDPADGIYRDGDLDRLNDRDLREWLLDHGARPETAREWPWLDALYDATFQFLDGCRERPSFEAGTALRFLLRIVFTSKHAVVYLLEGGMGEAFVAPLAEVLRDQGVRFELFHRLDGLELSADRRRVERLRFARQARPKDGAAYQPLVTWNGLRCWGAKPDWSQLEHGAEMERLGVDFESRWSVNPFETGQVVRRGADFDAVVMALPLGAIAPDPDGRTPCREWLDAVPHVRRAAEGIALAPSVAAQLWLRPDHRALGAGRDNAMCGWAAPFSIWSDMSQVLAHEGWRGAGTAPPGTTVYLTGAWETDAHLASSAERDTRARDRRAALEQLAAQLERHGAQLWPGLARPDGGFDWDALHEPPRPGAGGRAGADRLEGQYVRTNVEPADLCDGAQVGASALRPEAHESGLENLAIAGTWARTSINSTCVEAACMSGMAAARALGVEARPIVGEAFLSRPRPATPIPAASAAAGTDRIEPGGESDDHRDVAYRIGA
jgi:uncharacterized protein with NAD-binding domain and iron-sulfur cluster